MVLVYLHERRIFAPTQVFGTITSLGERTARRKVSDVGGKSGYLIKLRSLFMCGIRHTL